MDLVIVPIYSIRAIINQIHVYNFTLLRNHSLVIKYGETVYNCWTALVIVNQWWIRPVYTGLTMYTIIAYYNTVE